MDRLQKKCAIASTGFHLLLLLILMIGPAFFSSSRIAPDMVVLDFVPLKTVDALISGGGNPNAQPPPAAQPPAPQPQVQTRPQPPPPKTEPQPKNPEPTLPKEQIKEPVKTPAPDSDSLEVSEKPKKQIELKKTTRKNFSVASNQPSDSEKQAKKALDARRRVGEQISEVARNLGNSLSSGTSIELKGPGGGGIPYANFLQAVMSAYDRAWFLPEGVTDNDAATLVSVTIERSGKVVSARIIKASGNREVDRSVQLAIDRVKKVPALPESSENERTVEINFNVRAKRLLG